MVWNAGARAMEAQHRKFQTRVSWMYFFLLGGYATGCRGSLGLSEGQGRQSAFQVGLIVEQAWLRF